MDEINQQFDWFKDDGIFLPMLNDSGRNTFYDMAIKTSVKDKVVVDIGAGTGLLSVLSVRAGAKKVFAVEQDHGRFCYLKDMIAKLELDHKIELVNDDFLNTNISGDIYVSETINTQIFGEGILRIADHAIKNGGTFIPSRFEITPVIYKDHPIFLLDQTHPDAHEFDPSIDIDNLFVKEINDSLQKRHPLMDTLYSANQLNKLFQILPRFTDIKLQQLWKGDPLVVDLNRPLDIDSIKITIDAKAVPEHHEDWYLVLFWKAYFQDIVMDCKDVWFGNISKILRQDQRRPGTDINIWYSEYKKNWHVTF